MAGIHLRGVVVWCSAFAVSGCASIEQQVLTLMPPPSPVDQQSVEKRVDYQQTGSSEAIRWLLVHDVEQSMSPSEVSEALGEAGRRVREDGWITNDGGQFRVGDDVYKWGPDNQGNSYFLVFRDRKLVNFDPREFE